MSEVVQSLTQLIRFNSTESFRNETSNFLWVSHWITDLMIRLKSLNHLGIKQAAFYEWVIESLTYWFVQKALNHFRN